MMVNTIERLPDATRDPVLTVLRLLVEAFRAFWLEDSRHIRVMRLTPAQFDIVATLGETDGLICSDLADTTLLTNGTLTGVLDRLEAKGLIERVGMSGDRRYTLVRLTQKAEEVFHTVFPAHIHHLKPFLSKP